MTAATSSFSMMTLSAGPAPAIAPTPRVVAGDPGSRRAVRRAARGARLAELVLRPPGAARDAHDPLARPAAGRARRGGRALAFLLAAAALHGGALLGAQLLAPAARPAPRAQRVAVELRDVAPPTPPPAVPAPPPPPAATPAPPAPRAPELALAPPPRPRLATRPRKAAPARPDTPPPPPLAADPIDAAPPAAAPAPAPTRRRVVGLGFDSTAAGGSGPAFAIGNTRMGATDTLAGDPTAVERLERGAPDAPTGTGAEPTPVAAPNRAAARALRDADAGTWTLPVRAHALEPAYPDALRRLGVEGDVTVTVHVDASGRVTSARVVRGARAPEFDAAALEAARAERFAPATRDGAAIAYDLEYTYRFRLQPL